jgi:hypothetical protein
VGHEEQAAGTRWAEARAHWGGPRPRDGPPGEREGETWPRWARRGCGRWAAELREALLFIIFLHFLLFFLKTCFRFEFKFKYSS